MVYATMVVAVACQGEFNPDLSGATSANDGSSSENHTSGDATSNTGVEETSNTTTNAADDDTSGDTGDPVIPPCRVPIPVGCDHLSDDPWHAIGLNCPGGPQVDGVYNGSAQAIYVHEGNLGTYVDPVEGPPFPPREGNKFVILSSGIAQELTVAGIEASTNHPDGLDPGDVLPAPLSTENVSDTESCLEDPSLAGTGDCSNTIHGQWNQGSGAYDYAELRFTATVPLGITSMSYDFAMFSTEYPEHYQSQFNDMHVAWLESEQWTGNISFDGNGAAFSVNATWFDYKDAPNSHNCPAPCEAPELQGTAMEGHAGTKWMTTTAPVMSLEEVVVVLAVFDLSDSTNDTVILIDNFRWGCDSGPPSTVRG